MVLTKFSGFAKMSVTELKKYRLKMQFLNLLYGKGSMSAVELSKHAGISLPTTFSMLNDLKNEGWIDSAGTGISTGGRKPSIFRLSEDSFFVIACDMGRYKAKMTFFNSRNERVTPMSFIDTHINDTELTDKLWDAAKKLMSDYGIPPEKIIGLGVDMPGLVDSNKGINYAVRDPYLQPLREHLRKKFNTFVYIDNDARMQAYGEYIFGKAKGCRNALIIHWSWGVGLGMILNGQLVEGNEGFAGEFSHIQMADEGELCICGKRGCLETVASLDTLITLAKEGISHGKISQLTRQYACSNAEVTSECIISSAKMGDEFSISILNRIGMTFGKGLSYLIQLLNPEIIVLGGPVAKANQFILTPIQQALNRYCLEKFMHNTRIVISEMDEQSGLLGTAAMLYHRIFSGDQIESS
jgi:N-acetylglucosamine repressor